jgi:crossover junction endodeoxyribonuclease RusA
VARAPRILRIELPPGLDLLNANDRSHYRVRSKKTAVLRTEAYRAAKAHMMTFTRVKVRCIFCAPDNRRRDTSNVFPSYKACLDGLVDAGVLRDDNDKYVVSFEMLRGKNRTDKRSQLIIEIIEVDDD